MHSDISKLFGSVPLVECRFLPETSLWNIKEDRWAVVHDTENGDGTTTKADNLTDCEERLYVIFTNGQFMAHPNTAQKLKGFSKSTGDKEGGV